MKITFLGSGSSSVDYKHNYQNNILIDIPNATVLVDAGSTVMQAMKDLNIDYKEITDVVVTHCHGDHVFGLEGLGFSNYFGNEQHTPNLHSTDTILQEVESTIMPSMSHTELKRTTIYNYFFPRNLASMIDELPWLSPVPTHHVNGKESFGLSIHLEDSKIFYTSDTKFHIYEEYKTHALIFQDCEFAHYPNGVHAQFHQLCTLPPEIKSKMWLMHCNVEITHTLQASVVNQGFLGVVSRGQVFEF